MDDLEKVVALHMDMHDRLEEERVLLRIIEVVKVLRNAEWEATLRRILRERVKK